MGVDSKMIDDIIQRIRKELPGGIKELREDFDKNLRAILQSLFAKLDLVTRDEFDVQAELLARTREKLEQMQQQVGELEQALKTKSPRKASPKK